MLLKKQTNHISERSIILTFGKIKRQKQIKKNIQCVIIASEDTCREKPSKAQNVSYLT